MDSESDSTVIPVELPREHLVSTAVKFLLNPRVRPTTLAQKQLFLRKKGLTDQEIELACQKAAAFTDEQNNNVSGAVRPYYDTPRTSFWIKAKDVANMVALISIGSYSLYSFWKRYLSPRIFGTRSRQEQNYEKLLTSIIKLNENVIELKELIKVMQQTQHNASKSRNNYELQDLKSELTSIKGLLLGRNQFPSSPGIPSWQMLESGEGEDNSNENSDENSSRRRKNKSDRDRSRKEDVEDDGIALGTSGTTMRKHPSVDSNNGFHSGSSCEVVFVNKNDSDPDHSDE